MRGHGWVRRAVVRRLSALLALVVGTLGLVAPGEAAGAITVVARAVPPLRPRGPWATLL